MRSTAVTSNGPALAYERRGDGEPLLLIAPAATRATMWRLHQLDALCAAGYEVVTFDNRGTAPSGVPDGPYRVADLVADTAALIRELDIGPCHVVGASLGALVAQELALVRPDLVRAIALLGTKGRTSHFHAALAEGVAESLRARGPETSLHEVASGMLQLFGPATLANDRFTRDWLQIGMAFPVHGEGPASQYEATIIEDRLDALSTVTVPTLVVAFEHDVLMPPTLCREVAEAIPDCGLVEVPGCGHFGFLERPGDVNACLVDFLAATRRYSRSA